MTDRKQSFLFFLLVFIPALLASLVIPVWWSFSPFAFLASYWLGRTTARSFWKGFTGAGLAWLLLILYRSIPNDNILAGRMAAFFYLPHWSILILLSALLAGIIGGFSSVCGVLVKKAIQKP